MRAASVLRVGRRPGRGRAGTAERLSRLRRPPSLWHHQSPMSLSPEQPVAVFDSGVGGLTVLHELLVSLPTEDYLYLGDTARFPYGERSQAELQAFAVEIADHLLEAGAKLLVVACNAASSAAIDALERHLERSRPRRRRDRRASRRRRSSRSPASRTGRIGLLATPATVASGAYERAVARGRSARAPRERRLPRPRADHPGRLPVRRARRRDGPRVLRAAARGRRSTP